MVRCEICNKEIVSHHEHSFPKDIRDEKIYCVCIPWKSMSQCIELSLDNAQRFVKDSEYLFKAGRLSSAKVLSVLSLEETGKALFACEALARRKNVSKSEYTEKFHDHPAKINEAIKAIKEVFAFDLQKLKEEAMYVDYDGYAQLWVTPWSPDPESFIKTHDYLKIIIKNMHEHASAIRKHQAPILELYIKEVLIKSAKMAINCAQQRYEQIQIRF